MPLESIQGLMSSGMGVPGERSTVGTRVRATR